MKRHNTQTNARTQEKRCVIVWTNFRHAKIAHCELWGYDYIDYRLYTDYCLYTVYSNVRCNFCNGSNESLQRHHICVHSFGCVRALRHVYQMRERKKKKTWKKRSKSRATNERPTILRAVIQLRQQYCSVCAAKNEPNKSSYFSPKTIFFPATSSFCIFCISHSLGSSKLAKFPFSTAWNMIRR